MTTVKKKILLVEDDDGFRSILKVLLMPSYSIFEATNGLKAKEIINLQDFDLVISDIQMPHFSGVDLLEWIKKTKPMPVILITGFSQALEARKAAELGADDFLAKPFNDTELISKLNQLFGKGTNDEPLEIKIETKNLDELFFKVAIEDFVVEKDCDYAVYVRISQEKYIKIAHQGGKLTPERAQAFIEKGVTHLYVHRDDFPKLVGFTMYLSNALAANKKVVPRDKQARFMKYTGEVILEQVFMGGLSETSFNNARSFITSTLAVVSEDTSLFELLDAFSQHSDLLYTHSIAVSTFSVMIAREMGYQSPQAIFKIALGGLLHDIGKKEFDRALLDKPRHSLTSGEVAQIETHVMRGKDILESLPNMPSDVIQIAYEHHENLTGYGYPRKIDAKRIHPLAQIVAVADCFCEYTIPESRHSKIMTPANAILKIQTQNAETLNNNAIQALRALF